MHEHVNIEVIMTAFAWLRALGHCIRNVCDVMYQDCDYLCHGIFAAGRDARLLL